jgi:hypothetical protein
MFDSSFTTFLEPFATTWVGNAANLKKFFFNEHQPTMCCHAQGILDLSICIAIQFSGFDCQSSFSISIQS